MWGREVCKQVQGEGGRWGPLDAQAQAINTPLHTMHDVLPERGSHLEPQKAFLDLSQERIHGESVE